MKKMLMSHAAGALALAALLIPSVSFAADFMAAQQPVFQSNENASGNLYIAGGSVTTLGPVRGDLLAAGGTVVLQSPVGADVTTIGGNLSVLGDVQGDVRAAGGNVIVSGSVGGDVIAAGAQVQLSGKKIGGDVAVAGAAVRIDAPVNGSLRVAGNNVYIDSAVAGNAYIRARTLTLGPDAVITGNLSYSAPQKATLESGAQVHGATTYTQTAQPEVSPAAVAAFFSLALLVRFLMLLLGALVLGLVFRRCSTELVSRATARPFAEFGRGVLFFIVTPIISVLFLVTVIGIPFGALGLLGFGGAFVFVSLMSPVVLGSIVYRYALKKSEYDISWKTILLGTVIYVLVGAIPFVGWMLTLLFLLLVLGAAVDICWDEAREWR